MVFPAVQVHTLIEDGFVLTLQVVPRDLALRCCDLLWRQVQNETGAAPGDPATWTRPVHRIGCCTDEAFLQAATSSQLHAALD
jgi:hypothetical protein